VLIETGFAWLPALCWRLDNIWAKLKSETPHLKRLPSEYIRDSVWLTTQPMEEPEARKHLFDIVEWIGWDKLLFASDYPHWDYDEPARALPLAMDPAQRTKLFIGNAKAVYRI
jgi:predicted TIM-barrel fold metal-dependent hydrolase